MRMRPLWPGSDPSEISDWRLFSIDLEAFFNQQALISIIGVGHSLGGTVTLRSALYSPARFKAVILIDPVIFLPSIVVIWDLICRMRLGYTLNPLAKKTLNQARPFLEQN